MAGGWNDIGREVRRASAIQRVGRNVAWEYLSQPKPTDLSRVPPSPQSLTPDYLTCVLCREHPGAKVAAITLGAASSGSGDRCAFSVSYNQAGRDANLPEHLFFKSLDGFYTRLHTLRVGIIPNEPNFYRLIRPMLDVETPVPYHAVFEDRTYRTAIILDDVVKNSGAVFYEVATPMPRVDIEGMLALLGVVHGTFWNSARLDTEFRWLMEPRGFVNRLIEGMELEQLMRSGLQRARSVLPTSLASRPDDIWKAFLASVDLTSQSPVTYLHGDPHLRNYYRTAAGRVGLADWQVTLKGSWAHDVAYTMLTSLPIEQRRAWESDLLAYYLDRANEAGGAPPTPHAAWELYRRATMYTLVGWLVTVGYGALQPSMQPDGESLEIIRRAAAAVDDLATMDLLC